MTITYNGQKLNGTDELGTILYRPKDEMKKMLGG
jgi:hypothetical protein